MTDWKVFWQTENSSLATKNAASLRNLPISCGGPQGSV